MKKHILTVFLIVALTVGMAPMSAAAERTFIINGQAITKDTGGKGYNCSAYVSNLIANIYPKKPGITIQFTSTYNVLRNKSAAEREVTTAHVKEFIQSVQPGARIRVCESSNTTSNDGDNNAHGHTMLLAEKNDAAGTFTTLESVVVGGVYTPQVYDYTYESFAQKFHDKYASGYSAGYNAKYFYYIYDMQRHFGTVDSTASGPSTLAIKSPNAPKTLKQGSYFGLTGTVTSNYNITSVYGRIKNSSDVTVDSYQQTNINSKNFTIAYSNLDNNLEFNLLSPGAYYLTYEAADASGKNVSWKSDTFYIQSSTPCKNHTKGAYRRYSETHPHYQYWECAVCGNEFTDNSTKKLDSCTICNPPKPNCDKGHTWGSWTTVKEAACGAEGQRKRTCSVCGETETEAIAALKHNYRVDGETDEVIYYVCTNCGDSYMEEKEPEFVDNSGIVNFVAKNRYSNGMFRDVKSGDWFSSNVATAYSMGLMKGTGSGSFSPGNNVTIAETITLAARIHKIYHTNSDSFASYDGGNWYDPYVDYARENNIINTYYTYSRPATREEFVHILAKALPEEALENIAGRISFADSGDIIFMADVRLLSGAGVINGIQENGETYFKPFDNITRAEVAAVVGRMVKPSTRVGK